MKLLVSDVDDTLTGDDAALVALMQVLEDARDQLVVAYNSSRPCASIRRTLRELPHLRPPDYLIGALGTEIQEGRSGRWVSGYAEQFGEGWQRDKVSAVAESLGFAAHPDEFQTPYKASFDVPGSEAVERARIQLDQSGLQAKLIYSGGRNLDFIPPNAGKATAIRYLQERAGVDPAAVVVAGDSANDLDMFVDPYRGIVVANADPELKELGGPLVYHAQREHAAGVLEGLRFWGVVNK